MNRIRFRIALLVAAVVGIAAIIGPSGSQIRAQGPDIATEWINFWNSRNANGAPILFAHNVVYEDVPLGVVNTDIAELETFAQGYFAGAPPDAQFTLLASDLRGGHGTIEWLWTFTTTATFFGPTPGKQVAVRGVSVIELHGNKIVRNSDYWDLATVLREIGQL